VYRGGSVPPRRRASLCAFDSAIFPKKNLSKKNISSFADCDRVQLMNRFFLDFQDTTTTTRERQELGFIIENLDFGGWNLLVLKRGRKRPSLSSSKRPSWWECIYPIHFFFDFEYNQKKLANI